MCVCSVGNFRAYREIPLPYEIPSQTLLASDNNEDVSSSHYQQPVSKLGTLAGSLPHLTDPPNTATSPQNIPTTLRQHLDFEHQPSISSRRYGWHSVGTPQFKGAEASTPTMRALNAMGSALSKAHAQDFQRREPRLETRYNTDDEDDDSSHASEDEM